MGGHIRKFNDGPEEGLVLLLLGIDTSYRSRVQSSAGTPINYQPEMRVAPITGATASASPPAKDRSCVILATNDYNDHTYTLHHIDVAPFFSNPDPDTQAMDDDTPLPPASARFDRPPDARGCSVDFHRQIGRAHV